MNRRLRDTRRSNVGSLVRVERHIREVHHDVIDLWLAEWERHAESEDPDEAALVARVRGLARRFSRSAGMAMAGVQRYGQSEPERHLSLVEPTP